MSLTNVEQVKLTAFGSPSADFLEDSIVEWFLSENNNSVHEASIEALEAVINQIALSPEKESSGTYQVWARSLDSLEKRLVNLRRKKKRALVPMVIGTGDRKDWKDFDKVFGGE